MNNLVCIGGRFETIYSRKLQNFVGNICNQYSGIEMKVYDVNSGKNSCIVQKIVKDIDNKRRVQYGAYIYGDISNDLINFGVFAEVKVVDALEYKRQLLQEMNFKHYVLFGKKFNFKSSLKKSSPIITCSVPYKRLKKYFVSFIERINEVFELRDNWVMYYPEIKVL